MAILDSELLKHLRGHVGKQLVFKQYGDKTVVTRYPNMKRVKRSPLQKAGTRKFADAVAYAQSIFRNPKNARPLPENGERENQFTTLPSRST